MLIELTDAGSGLGIESRRKCSLNTDHILRVDDSPEEHPGAAVVLLSNGDQVNVEETRVEVTRKFEELVKRKK